MAIPLWLLASYVGGQAIKGGLDAYGKEQERKAKIRGLKGQQEALANLAKVTPSEREYVKRRRQIMKQGDPTLKAEFDRRSNIIRQQGQFMRQRQQGQTIQQGLENSIVAQELRRRVDQDVLSSVAEQARQLALANVEAKRRAENELEAMQLRTDARKQQVKYQQAQVGAKIDEIPGYDRWGTLLKIAWDVAEPFADAYMSKHIPGWKDIGG